MQRIRKKFERSSIKIIILIVILSSSLIGAGYSTWQDTNHITTYISTGSLNIVGDDEYSVISINEQMQGNHCEENECFYSPELTGRVPIKIELKENKMNSNEYTLVAEQYCVSFKITNEGSLPARFEISDEKTRPHKSSYIHLIGGGTSNNYSGIIRNSNTMVKTREGHGEILLNLVMNQENILYPGESMELYTEQKIPLNIKFPRNKLILDSQVCIKYETLNDKGFKADTCNSIAVKKNFSDTDLINNSKDIIMEEEPIEEIIQEEILQGELVEEVIQEEEIMEEGTMEEQHVIEQENSLEENNREELERLQEGISEKNTLKEDEERLDIDVDL